jgi:hypothetical protein
MRWFGGTIFRGRICGLMTSAGCIWPRSFPSYIAKLPEPLRIARRAAICLVDRRKQGRHIF